MHWIDGADPVLVGAAGNMPADREVVRIVWTAFGAAILPGCGRERSEREMGVVAPPAGFEPATNRLEGGCSIP
jgi:hypothetical protein